MAELVGFWIIAPISVAAALAMILQRNAVHAALLLILNFFTLALFFLLLGSDFLFVVQIIVYAGAIMVLFLFVIMLLGVDRRESLRERIAGQRPLGVLLGLGLVAEVIVVVRLGIGLHGGALPSLARMNAGGNTRALALVLFNQYFFPFEVTSILLIVAAVGVMLYARRHPGDDRPVDAQPEGSGDSVPLEPTGGVPAAAGEGGGA